MTLTKSQAKLDRWISIMQSCDMLGFLTTSQIQRLHNLSGRRNTLRILNDMGDYLNSFHDGELVWYLSIKGRRELGSETVHRRTPLVQHTIMRNEVYVTYRPDLWKAEYPIKYVGKEIVADAIMRKDGAYVFVEIDLTQSMAANERKIAAYRDLRSTNRWQQKYGPFPTLLFVTTTDYRRQKLRAMMGDMKAEILTFSEIS